jgi:hypothetical protein
LRASAHGKNLGREYADISCVALEDATEGFSLATSVSCASTGPGADQFLLEAPLKDADRREP